MVGRGSSSVRQGLTVVSALGFGCVIPVLSALCNNNYYIHSAMCRVVGGVGGT